MSTPIGSHHGGNGSDSGSVNALLAIDAEAKAKIRTLVVDDEHTLRETCGVLLRNEGYDVTVCARGNDALDLVKRRPFDIALFDLYMSQVDGLTLLQAALATNPDTIVIVMTGNPSVESSIEALRLGAWNYLPKPFAAQHLQIMIGRAAHTVLVGQETREQQADPDRAEDAGSKATLLGTSAAFRRVIELAGRVAPTDASVFITGESGSGKELIAQFIHQHSRRSSRPFVPVNCAALPEPLLESEMFGHRKGAFTGAVRDKPGLLETANGGTLFLDELVEMSKPIQAKLLGTSVAFRRVIELARRVAPTDASVFITGESGAGKELIAQFIHQHSRRSSRPFVAVNCAALPEPLLESEMFGHRKGAFTGAVRDKPGLLETANGGTLLLDELVEMSKPIQAKLLRVIQDGVVRRVGSETTDAVVNVRFIAATNGDPEAAVKAGTMRQDLYYRLRVVPIHVPPLRERPEDIPLLAEHFLSTYWLRHRKPGEPLPKLAENAIRTLCTHPWVGNVRELQNVIEHVAVLTEPGAVIRPDDLPLTTEAQSPVSANTASLISTMLQESYHGAREQVIAQFETQYLTWLLSRAGGNMSNAARIAGVDRTTLYRLMERHGLQRSPNAVWVVERESSEEPEAAPESQQSQPAV